MKSLGYVAVVVLCVSAPSIVLAKANCATPAELTAEQKAECDKAAKKSSAVDDFFNKKPAKTTPLPGFESAGSKAETEKRKKLASEAEDQKKKQLAEEAKKKTVDLSDFFK